MLRISLRGIKHFEAKKVDRPYQFIKSNIPFLTQNSINGKSLNWTPTGYAIHLPSGDKNNVQFTHLKKRNLLMPCTKPWLAKLKNVITWCILNELIGINKMNNFGFICEAAAVETTEDGFISDHQMNSTYRCFLFGLPVLFLLFTCV